MDIALPEDFFLFPRGLASVLFNKVNAAGVNLLPKRRWKDRLENFQRIQQ
jgi:hypothetical protein